MNSQIKQLEKPDKRQTVVTIVSDHMQAATRLRNAINGVQTEESQKYLGRSRTISSV